jgi:predicted transcriptional regulator of viral defense system
LAQEAALAILYRRPADLDSARRIATVAVATANKRATRVDRITARKPWVNDGLVSDVMGSLLYMEEPRENIRADLGSWEGEFSYRDVMVRLGATSSQARCRLAQASRRGEIRRLGRNIYVAVRSAPIADWLADMPEVVSLAQLKGALDISYRALQMRIARALQAGRLVRIRRGAYRQVRP